MIYVTGDTHGGFMRFDPDIFPEQKNLTKEDYVVICGDFGAVWTGDNMVKGAAVPGPYGFNESYEENERLNFLEKLPFSILFVSGNHENFDALKKYPEKNWKGGKVREIRPSVLLLQRGYIFNIDGIKCFAFGGARSHDINGGVFEPNDKKGINRALKGTFPFRINHISWWKEEEPSKEEYERGIKNLEANNWEVDFVFTHECSASTNILLYCKCDNSYQLPYYFEDIRARLKFKKWFFGHHHDNRNINNNEILIYEQIIPIARNEHYYDGVF